MDIPMDIPMILLIHHHFFVVALFRASQVLDLASPESADLRRSSVPARHFSDILTAKIGIRHTKLSCKLPKWDSQNVGLYHLTSEVGIQLAKRRRDQQELGFKQPKLGSNHRHWDLTMKTRLLQ